MNKEEGNPPTMHALSRVAVCLDWSSERMGIYSEVIRDTVRVRPMHGERSGGDCRVGGFIIRIYCFSLLQYGFNASREELSCPETEISDSSILKETAAARLDAESLSNGSPTHKDRTRNTWITRNTRNTWITRDSRIRRNTKDSRNTWITRDLRNTGNSKKIDREEELVVKEIFKNLFPILAHSPTLKSFTYFTHSRNNTSLQQQTKKSQTT
ncbi:hypothetical protein YC2023_071376 [Brassica napus]